MGRGKPCSGVSVCGGGFIPTRLSLAPYEQQTWSGTRQREPHAQLLHVLGRKGARGAGRPRGGEDEEEEEEDWGGMKLS